MIRAMTEIELPASALVVLVGVSGAGKTTFAARHFGPTQVLSSDAFRAIVADDPADQRATRAAFELLHLAARRRLERGRLTVIDATNVTRPARIQLIAIAERAHRPAVAIVLDPATEIAVARNASRDGRTVAAKVVERQAAELARWVGGGRALDGEGFAAVHRRGRSRGDGRHRDRRPGAAPEPREAAGRGYDGPCADRPAPNAEERPMTEQRWRSVAIVLAVVLVGLVGLIFFTDLPPGSPGPTTGPSARTRIAVRERQRQAALRIAGDVGRAERIGRAERLGLDGTERQPDEPADRRPRTGSRSRASSSTRDRIPSRQVADVHVPHRRSRVGHGQAVGEEPAGHHPVLPQGRRDRHPAVPDLGRRHAHRGDHGQGQDDVLGHR